MTPQHLCSWNTDQLITKDQFNSESGNTNILRTCQLTAFITNLWEIATTNSVQCVHLMWTLQTKHHIWVHLLSFHVNYRNPGSLLTRASFQPFQARYGHIFYWSLFAEELFYGNRDIHDELIVMRDEKEGIWIVNCFLGAQIIYLLQTLD